MKNESEKKIHEINRQDILSSSRRITYILIFVILLFIYPIILLSVQTLTIGDDIAYKAKADTNILLEIIKSSPLALPAFIVGFFSVVFWALNSNGRIQKSALKVNEKIDLLEHKFEVVNRLIDEPGRLNKKEATLLKSALMTHRYLHYEDNIPENQEKESAFDLINFILRKE